MRTLPWLLTLALAAPAALAAPEAQPLAANTVRRKKAVKRRPARKRPVKKAAARTAPHRARAQAPATVPVDIGIGPAVHFITGPLQDDGLHYGLKVSVQAILSQAFIKSQAHRIPKKWRGMATSVKEARITPSLLIPDTLFLSPKLEHTQMWGINWRPLALSIPLLRTPRFAIGPGVNLTYAYIDSDLPALGTTHFLRPGLDATADLEIPFSDSFLISVGWTSLFYLPQKVGGPIFEWGALDESIWHIGQAYLKLHFRFPYKI
ncbi:MAG: hypothetical protein KC613_02050 [Myxococcales bacterium]|nr:hypothetical protein [Myxococcales bacterium]